MKEVLVLHNQLFFIFNMLKMILNKTNIIKISKKELLKINIIKEPILVLSN